MSAAVWVPWLAAFVLESAGAFFAYRKRLTSLFYLLAFGVVADIGCAITRFFYGKDALGNGFWIQSVPEYFLLCWLGCSICARLMEERRRSEIIKACFLFALAGSQLIAITISNGHTLQDKLLDSEIAVDALLLIIVAVGWIARKGKLQSPWNWIAAGFLVRIGSDLLCTMLWEKWPMAQNLYAIGELATLAIWAYAPLAKLSEVRIGIGQRVVEAEKVSVC